MDWSKPPSGVWSAGSAFAVFVLAVLFTLDGVAGKVWPNVVVGAVACVGSLAWLAFELAEMPPKVDNTDNWSDD